MIWPFSSTKQAALEAPAVPWDQQVVEALGICKREALALNFVKVSVQDPETRGRFTAVIERMLELAPAVDWSGERGAYIARSLIAGCIGITNVLHEHELDRSFTEAMASEGWNGNPFGTLSHAYNQMKERAKDPSTAQATGAAEKVSFPTFAHPDEGLQARVAELAAAWHARANQDLSVEDRYFLEAVATSYLPESIQLLTSLRAEPKLAQEAEKMFRKQVALLQARLTAIEDRSAKRQLEAMAVHTAFLEERLRAEPLATERLSIAR